MEPTAGADHEDLGPGGNHPGDVLEADVAVDHDRDRKLPLVEEVAALGDLANRRGHQRLTGKARIDGHQEHEVQALQDVFDLRKGRGRVQRRPGLDAPVPDQRQRAVQVPCGLRVDGDQLHADLGQRPDVLVRVLDHQVHVQRQRRLGPQLADHVRPQQQVRHEMAVGHVNVQHVGPGRLEAPDRVLQVAQVGARYRRGYPDGLLCATG